MSFWRSLFQKNKPFDYVSGIDEFIQGFDAKHPKKSKSQIQEIKKFEPIFYRRDHVVKSEDQDKVWEGF